MIYRMELCNKQQIYFVKLTTAIKPLITIKYMDIIKTVQ